MTTQTGDATYPLWPCSTNSASVITQLNAGDSLLLEAYKLGRPYGVSGGQTYNGSNVACQAYSTGTYYTSSGGIYTQCVSQGTSFAITYLAI